MPPTFFKLCGTEFRKTHNLVVEEMMPGSERQPLTEDDKKPLDKEISDFVEGAKEMTESTQVAVDKLRDAADYLDKVWKDCRIATAVGSGVGIVGGFLTIGGGIATALTAGIAPPLLIAGIAVGAVGAGTNLGTSAIETLINSSQVKAADEALKKADEVKQKVMDTVHLWRRRKDTAKLAFFGKLASKMLNIDLDVTTKNIINGLLQSKGFSLFETTPTCATALAESTTKAAGKAGLKLGTKTAGGIIIGASAVFVIVDALEFGFTVRDLVQDKKSDAAKSLRQKAKDIEAQLKGR